MANRPRAEMRAEVERDNAAAAVPLAMERALKLGVPRRALATSMARVLGVALVTVAAKQNAPELQLERA